MPNYQNSFFKKIDSSSVAAVIAKNKPIIEELSQKIELFKNYFLTELKQAKQKDRKELDAAIQRSDRCLATLKKMEANSPIEPKDGQLLAEFLEQLHISGAESVIKLFEEISLSEEASPNGPAKI